jgi:FMN phosphatase YigB (HAD superfamily)
LAKDKRNMLLPQLMCDLMQDKTAQEIKEAVQIFLNNHPTYFPPTYAGKAEKELLLGMAHMMCTPSHFASIFAPVKETVFFIKELRNQGHKIYGLTNWDRESLALLKKLHPTIFALFETDGIVASSDPDVQQVKPGQKPYEQLLKKHSLNVKECVLFDDRSENIAQAHLTGITGILVKLKGSKPHIALARQEFYERHALQCPS